MIRNFKSFEINRSLDFIKLNTFDILEFPKISKTSAFNSRIFKKILKNLYTTKINSKIFNFSKKNFKLRKEKITKILKSWIFPDQNFIRFRSKFKIILVIFKYWKFKNVCLEFQGFINLSKKGFSNLSVVWKDFRKVWTICKVMIILKFSGLYENLKNSGFEFRFPTPLRPSPTQKKISDTYLHDQDQLQNQKLIKISLVLSSFFWVCRVSTGLQKNLRVYTKNEI